MYILCISSPPKKKEKMKKKKKKRRKEEEEEAYTFHLVQVIPSALPPQLDCQLPVLMLLLLPLAHAVLSLVQQSGSIASQMGSRHNNEQLTIKKIYRPSRTMKQHVQVQHLLGEMAFVEAQDYLTPAAQYKESILTNREKGNHSILTVEITVTYIMSTKLLI